MPTQTVVLAAPAQQAVPYVPAAQLQQPPGVSFPAQAHMDSAAAQTPDAAFVSHVQPRRLLPPPPGLLSQNAAPFAPQNNSASTLAVR